MIRINLLPRRRRRAGFPRVGLLAVVAAVVVLFAAGWVALSVRTSGVRSEIAGYDREIAELQPQVQDVQRLQRAIDALKNKEQVITELEARRLPWARILVEVSALVPRDVWLVSIFSEGPGDLGISGSGLSFTAVARFMRNLEGSAMFENVDLTTASRADINQRKVVAFGVTMNLVPQALKVGSRP